MPFLWLFTFRAGNRVSIFACGNLGAIIRHNAFSPEKSQKGDAFLMAFFVPGRKSSFHFRLRTVRATMCSRDSIVLIFIDFHRFFCGPSRLDRIHLPFPSHFSFAYLKKQKNFYFLAMFKAKEREILIVHFICKEKISFSFFFFFVCGLSPSKSEKKEDEV